MYVTKSFCNIAALRSNEPGKNSALGELTTYGKTYSREVGTYIHTTEKGYALSNFRSLKDNVEVIMPQANVDQIISLVKICVDRTLTTSGEIYDSEIYDELMTYSATLKFKDLKIGRMMTDGTHWVPAYLMWTDTRTGAGTNTHRVWLAIDAFLNQYTDFTHIVVPPFEPIDQFFAAPSVVKALLDAITPSQMMDRAQEARGGIPETVIRTNGYNYIDLSNTDRKFLTYWSVVINGEGGDNPDAIKDSLVDWILAHSQYPRARWEQILPDIFKRTEFIMVPFWNQWAAEATNLKNGVYSPFVNSDTTHTNIVAKNAPNYTSAHVKANTVYFGFPYKSVAIGTIGSVDNRDGKIRISQWFPDFVNVGTENADFNRMSSNTQEWALKLMEAVTLAEEWYDGADIKRGYYRIERNGLIFIAFSQDNVLFLVVTKELLKV